MLKGFRDFLTRGNVCGLVGGQVLVVARIRGNPDRVASGRGR